MVVSSQRPGKFRQRYLLSMVSALFVLLAGACAAPIQLAPLESLLSHSTCQDPATFATAVSAAAGEDLVRPRTRNIINCLNTAHYREAVLQVTPEFLQAEFGFSDPDLAPEIMAGFPPFAVESLSNVRQLDDGRFSIELLYRREVGAHMLVHEQWIFTEHNGALLLSDLDPLPVPMEDDYIKVDVVMFDYGYELSSSSFAPEDSVVFHVVNRGDYPHQFLVFRLPDDTTIEEVRQGNFGEGFEFIGQTTALAGEVATHLVLVNLRLGVYAVICFGDEPEGTPHLARGMVSSFAVE